MTESALLITASITMVLVSLAAAGLLVLAVADPLWVIAGGTMAGLATYLAFCTIGEKFVHPVVAEQDQRKEDAETAASLR